jgi:hypothetical protein
MVRTPSQGSRGTAAKGCERSRGSNGETRSRRIECIALAGVATARFPPIGRREVVCRSRERFALQVPEILKLTRWRRRTVPDEMLADPGLFPDAKSKREQPRTPEQASEAVLGYVT